MYLPLIHVLLARGDSLFSPVIWGGHSESFPIFFFILLSLFFQPFFFSTPKLIFFYSSSGVYLPLIIPVLLARCVARLSRLFYSVSRHAGGPLRIISKKKIFPFKFIFFNLFFVPTLKLFILFFGSVPTPHPCVARAR